MKEHAKKALKHDTKVLDKTVPTMLIIGLFLVGGGSAALLSSFGSVSGNADVTQAVYFADGEPNTVDTEVTTAFDGSLVAGQTTTTDFTLVNNATREAEVALNSGASDIEGIEQVVRKADGAKAQPQQEAGSPLDIEVDPSEDSVSYTVELPESYVNQSVDLVISREDESNYHVKYYPARDADLTTDGWGFKTDGTLEPLDVDSNDEVISRSAEDSDSDGNTDYLEITVERESGYMQTFGVNAYDTLRNTDNWETTGFTYSGDNIPIYNQKVTDTSESTRSSVTLPANGQTDFQVSTDFHVALDPEPADGEPTTQDGEDYRVDLAVQPVTS